MYRLVQDEHGDAFNPKKLAARTGSVKSQSWQLEIEEDNFRKDFVYLRGESHLGFT
jgi:hypothetical protein